MFLKKRDKSISLLQKFYNRIFYYINKSLIRSVRRMDSEMCENINKSNIDEVEKIRPLISEYVNLFITIDNFKLSYPGDPPSRADNEDFNKYMKSPHKISMISFADMKSEKKYVIYLECEIKDKYNTKIIFHTENVPYSDPKIVSLIRDKKLSELV